METCETLQGDNHHENICRASGLTLYLNFVVTLLVTRCTNEESEA